MDSKEAIDVLKNRIKLPDYGASYGSVCEADYQKEAIDAAVSALEAIDPAANLISTMRNNKKAALWLRKYGKERNYDAL